jgi:hypothetical protein
MLCGLYCVCAAGDQEQMAAELERSKASVARLLKERNDLEEKLKGLGKELRQAINEKSVQVTRLHATQLFGHLPQLPLYKHKSVHACPSLPADGCAQHLVPKMLHASCDCCTQAYITLRFQCVFPAFYRTFSLGTCTAHGHCCMRPRQSAPG